MKAILVAIFLAVSFCSCNNKTEDEFLMKEKLNNVARSSARVEGNELKKALKAHHSFMETHKKNGFENFQNQLNDPGLKSDLKKAKSQKEVIEIYQRAGMKNADKYVKSMDQLRIALVKEIQSNPEMLKWTSEQKRAYMSEIFGSYKLKTK